MEVQRELAYKKNLGYYWITGLGNALFLTACTLFGGVLLALFPVMFAAVELIGSKKDLIDVQVTKVDVGITVVGCLVTSLSIITLSAGFAFGDWIWALSFFGLYGGLCALLGFVLGTAVLTYESPVDESERLEASYDSGFA